MLDKDAAILDILRRDPRYRAEAYQFVFEALDYTLTMEPGESRLPIPPIK